MLKRRGLVLAVASLALLTLPWASAHAGVFVSVGVPGPYYGPYYHRHYYYYGPRVYVGAPVVVAAPPPPGAVYVQQPTVIYQQGPAPQAGAPTITAAPPETVVPPLSVPAPAR